MGPITGEADRCRAWLLMCHDDTCWTTSCLGVGAPRAEESLVDPLSCHGFAVRKHMGIPAGVRELRVPEQLANGLQVEVVVEHHRRRRVSEVVEPPRGIFATSHSFLKSRLSARGSVGPPVSEANTHPPLGPCAHISLANRSAAWVLRWVRSSAVNMAGMASVRRPASDFGAEILRPPPQRCKQSAPRLAGFPAPLMHFGGISATMLPSHPLQLTADDHRALAGFRR